MKRWKFIIQNNHLENLEITLPAKVNVDTGGFLSVLYTHGVHRSIQNSVKKISDSLHLNWVIGGGVESIRLSQRQFFIIPGVEVRTAGTRDLTFYAPQTFVGLQLIIGKNNFITFSIHSLLSQTVDYGVKTDPAVSENHKIVLFDQVETLSRPVAFITWQLLAPYYTKSKQ